MKEPADPVQSLLARMESLADPIRLRLLRLLEAQELGVVDLCDVLQMPQSTVSRHLKVLADRQWVRSRRQGATHWYGMTSDELDTPARGLWALARAQTLEWPAVAQDQLRLARRLAERESDSRSFFASAARDWDALRAESFGARFGISAMLALLPPGLVVADLGCGTGSILAELGPHVKRAIGVDNSADMLAAARARCAGMPGVELLQADLSAVPLPVGACDATVCVLSLIYVPDPAKVLLEMHRLLRPGGRAVIVDLLPHSRDDFRRFMGQKRLGFEEATVRSLVTAAGFAGIDRFEAIAPEQQAKGPALFLATATR